MAFISGYLAILSAYTSPANFTEISGNGYARQAVTLNYDPASNTISLPDGATFGPGTGAGTAGVNLAIFDASSNGNMLMTWAQAEVALASGTSITYPATVPLVAVTNGLFTPATGANLAAVAQGAIVGSISVPGTIPLASVNVIAGVPLAYNKSANTLTAASAVLVLTDAATVTLDTSQFNPALVGEASWTIAGTGRTFTMINPTNAQEIMLFLKQDATGSRTVTTWTNVMWAAGTAPTLTTTAAATDVLRFTYNATLAKWVGETVGKAYA